MAIMGRRNNAQLERGEGESRSIIWEKSVLKNLGRARGQLGRWGTVGKREREFSGKRKVVKKQETEYH